MRRSFALLLTVMLAFASFASTAHAMPNGPIGGDVVEDVAPGASIHAAMPGEMAASCCAGETQRSGPSCPMILAVLPAGAPTPRPVIRSTSFAMLDIAHDGLDPEQLLDPPRS